jgi:hypothetical protein
MLYQLKAKAQQFLKNKPPATSQTGVWGSDIGKSAKTTQI